MATLTEQWDLTNGRQVERERVRRWLSVTRSGPGIVWVLAQVHCTHTVSLAIKGLETTFWEVRSTEMF